MTTAAPAQEITADLRSLVNAVEWANGAAFFFVVADHPDLRDAAVAAVRSALRVRELQVLQITRETTSVFDAVRALAPRERQTVAVVGIENAIGAAAGAERAAVVRGLNASRDAMAASIPVPVIFFLPAYALQAVMRGAPDFFSTRSGIYTASELGVSAPTLDHAEQALRSTGGWLPEAARNERISELLEIARGIFESGIPSGAEAADYLRLVDRAARIMVDAGRYSEAVALVNDVLPMAEQWKLANLRARLMMRLAGAYARQGALTAAVVTIQAAASTGTVDDLMLAADLADLRAYIMSLTDADAAVALADEALSLALQTEDPHQVAFAHATRGFALWQTRAFDAAEREFDAALAMVRPDDDGLIRAMALGYRSRVRLAQGRLSEAEQDAREAVEFFSAADDFNNLSVALGDLERVLATTGDHEGALEVTRKLIELQSKIEMNPATLLAALRNAELASSRLGRANEADQWSSQWHALAEKLDLDSLDPVLAAQIRPLIADLDKHS